MNEEKKEALRKEFSALLDKELDPETRATLEAELAEDAELLRELDLLKKVDALYQQLPRHNAPADFEARVHAALESSVVPLSRFQKMLRWGVPPLALAATLMIVSAIYFSLNDTLPSEKFNMTKAPQEESAVMPEEIEQSKKAQLPKPVPASAPREESLKADDALAPRANTLGRVQEDKGVVGKESRQAHQSIGDGRMDNTNPPAPVIAYEPEPIPMPPPSVPSPLPAPVPMPSPKAAVTPEKFLSGSRFPTNTPLGAAPSLSTAPAPEENMRRDTDTMEGIEIDDYASNERSLMKDEKNIVTAKPKRNGSFRSSGFGIIAGGLPAGMAVDTEETSQQNSPDSHFQKLRNYLKETRDKRERGAIEEARIAGDRQFNLAQSVWVETTYQDEDPVYLEKGSRSLKKLQRKHAELEEIVALGNFILVKIGDTWYFIYDLGVAEEE